MPANGVDKTTVGLFYASQTGTAEEVAWELAREARRRGWPLEPRALDETSIQELSRTKIAIFVVSTTGQGDPPLNMRRLWQEMLSASLPPTLLAEMSYTVFGLGDRRYREFNYAARKLHARLGNLGAKSFHRLGLGDDQHDFGMEQELDPWAEGLWAALAELRSPLVPTEDDGDTRYEVEELGSDFKNGDGDDSNLQDLPADGFSAEVVAKRSLCSHSHAAEVQDVWNIRLRLPPSATYAAGDVLVVWPRTQPSLVERFVVETLERSLEEFVRIRPRSVAASPFPVRPLSLRELFSRYLDVTSVPSRYFFHVLSLHTQDELHKKKLSEFASRSLEAKDALYEYCKRERRSAAEVMWDFWTARPPLPALISALPLLRPRRYSIASSPRWIRPLPHTPWPAGRLGPWPWTAYLCSREDGLGSTAIGRALETGGEAGNEAAPLELDLCVGIVNSVTRSNREVKGLCSNFLKDAVVGARIQCSLEEGSLKLPPPDVPLLMVCPGTGLSPCRALLQQRHLQLLDSAASYQAHDRQKDLLFLGFRHQDGDFLYGEEWSTFSNWLSVHVAFSRDHDDRKVYVQDIIEEAGEQVVRLLDAGAMIFVCGRSHPMPSQVFDAFVEVLQKHAGQPPILWNAGMWEQIKEELVLQLRLLDLGDHPGDFLRLAPEPPALEAVERAIRSLVAIGALENSSKLGLTPLGFHLAHMPVDARIGKMLVYGSLCQCLAPILTIAACLSQKSPFVRSFNRTKEELQVTERQGAWGYLSSDQLAVVKAFEKYQEQKLVSRDAAWEVCDRFGLSASTLDDMAQLRRQFLRHLTETGFAMEEAEDGGEQVNIHKKNMSLVRCVLCAGLFPSVAQVQKHSNSRGTSYQIFVSRQNERCTPHPSSLNFKAQDFAANHGWLLFHDKVKTTQVYLHDTTLVGAIPLLLFGGELKISSKDCARVHLLLV
ncbi:ndor1 [Symbiodinium natans]|uniref:Ndor1 protein n=1 Tax=Symbiodinium natans TaxID=878477 RepID=A0A812N9P0_9DINO|nr:ndor1 [Symbiodinium natans]